MNERRAVAVLVRVLLMCLAYALTLSSAGLCCERSILDAKRVTLNLVGEDMTSVLQQLNQQVQVPICAELRSLGPRYGESPRYNIELDDVSGRTAMDQVVKVLGTYVWRETKEPYVINLMPADLADDPEWFMNLKCPGFKLENASFREAANRINELLGLEGDRRIGAGGAYSIMYSGKLEDHWLYKFHNQRFTLTVKEGTVRNALNQIAAGAENARWVCAEGDSDGRRWRGVAFQPIIVPEIVKPETGTEQGQHPSTLEDDGNGGHLHTYDPVVDRRFGGNYSGTVAVPHGKKATDRKTGAHHIC